MDWDLYYENWSYDSIPVCPICGQSVWSRYETPLYTPTYPQAREYRAEYICTCGWRGIPAWLKRVGSQTVTSTV